MPTYEYACTSCGEHLEVVQSFKDDPLVSCPTCEGRLRKVFAPIGIVFKGSGFYKTDSRGGSSKSAGAASPSAEKASGSDTTASSSDTGSSTKETKDAKVGPSGSGSGSGSGASSTSSTSSGSPTAAAS